MEAAFLALAMWAQQGYLPRYTTGQITCGVYALDGDIWYGEPKELQGTANGKRFVILSGGGSGMVPYANQRAWDGVQDDLVLRWEDGPIRHGAPSIKIEKAKIARMCHILVQHGDGSEHCLTGWVVPGRPHNPVDGDIWYGDDGKPLYGRINGKWVRLKPLRKPRVQPQK